MREETSDFPAAHSMDSGWFAIDNEGELAHFETGEAGALLTVSPYQTGESITPQSQELYERYIAPWIARNLPREAVAPGRGVEMLVFFERGEDALALARSTDEVVLVARRAEVLSTVKDTDALRDRLTQTPGFIGVAPRSLHELFELYYHYDTALPSPISFYVHGNWDVPGHYIRKKAAAANARIDAPCHQLDVVFAEHDSIHLAEIEEDYNFETWGDGDLSGYPPPRPPSPPPAQVLWSWLSGFFKKEDDS